MAEFLATWPDTCVEQTVGTNGGATFIFQAWNDVYCGIERAMNVVSKFCISHNGVHIVSIGRFRTRLQHIRNITEPHARIRSRKGSRPGTVLWKSYLHELPGKVSMKNL